MLLVHGVDVRPNHGFDEATLSVALGGSTLKREKGRANSKLKGKYGATGKGLTRERAKGRVYISPEAGGAERSHCATSPLTAIWRSETSACTITPSNRCRTSLETDIDVFDNLQLSELTFCCAVT